MNRFSSNGSITNEIKDRVDIIDIISEVVSLKKAGNNYKGLCPFHGEKTPSFVVSKDKQIFTCFGCGATGDAIEFTKKYYNIEFTEAIERLAKRAGIEYSYQKRDSSEKYNIYYQINRDAALFFFKNLVKSDNLGYKYIRNRGISQATIKAFAIGYANDSWNDLYNHLKDKYDSKLLLELGLISEKNGRYFDKFRNRVMFPIIDTRGRVIGFGGRAIGNQEPKYLNSSESLIFKKKNNLYGLNSAKKEISKHDKAVLVEGYMDVVSLAQSGIKFAIASLGTALTTEQAKLLNRYSKNTILAYDSDDAGTKAALRGIDVLLAANCNPKVLIMKDAKDPDEFIRKFGEEEFLNLLSFSLSYTEFRINILKRRYDLDKEESKIAFVKEVSKLLKRLSPVEAEVYITKLSQEINVSARAIHLEIKGLKGITNPSLSSGNAKTDPVKKVGAVSVFEKTILRLAIYSKDFCTDLENSGYIFKRVESKSLFEKIKEIYLEQEIFDFLIFKGLIEEDDEMSSLLDDIYENIKLGEQPRQILEDCLANINLEALKAREAELIMQISIAEENEEEHKEELNKLQKELLHLRTKGGLANGK